MNAKMKQIVLLVGMALCTAVPGRASLRWEVLEQSVTVPIGATMTQLKFRAINEGDEPVSIRSIVPSCSCMHPKASLLVIPPGKETEVVVDYSIEDRTGEENRVVVVNTDKAPKSTPLKVTVVIPKVATVSQSAIIWTGEARGQTRKVDIKLNPALGVKVTEARIVNSDAFTIDKLSLSGDGAEAALEITPRTGVVSSSLVRVATDRPLPNGQRIFVYLFVR